MHVNAFLMAKRKKLYFKTLPLISNLAIICKGIHKRARKSSILKRKCNSALSVSIDSINLIYQSLHVIVCPRDEHYIESLKLYASPIIIFAKLTKYTYKSLFMNNKNTRYNFIKYVQYYKNFISN